MTDLAVRENGSAIAAAGNWDSQQVEVLRNLIAPGVSDQEFALFGQVCKRTGLDPFARQIYAISRKVYNKETRQKEPKMTIQVSIDGLRLIADRSGQYAGSETLWCGPDGQWVDVWLNPGYPAAAKTTVWKNGSDRTFTGVARFDAYCQRYEGKPQGLWETMGDVMIGKCSEALALRKAFPAEMSGLYTREEMQQADNVPVSVEAGPSYADLAAEAAAYGKANGLTSANLQAICRDNNLPNKPSAFTTKAQVDTFFSEIEDAIADSSGDATELVEAQVA